MNNMHTRLFRQRSFCNGLFFFFCSLWRNVEQMARTSRSIITISTSTFSFDTMVDVWLRGWGDFIVCSPSHRWHDTMKRTRNRHEDLGQRLLCFIYIINFWGGGMKNLVDCEPCAVSRSRDMPPWVRASPKFFFFFSLSPHGVVACVGHIRRFLLGHPPLSLSVLGSVTPDCRLSHCPFPFRSFSCQCRILTPTHLSHRDGPVNTATRKSDIFISVRPFPSHLTQPLSIGTWRYL